MLLLFFFSKCSQRNQKKKATAVQSSSAMMPIFQYQVTKDHHHHHHLVTALWSQNTLQCTEDTSSQVFHYTTKCQNTTSLPFQELPKTSYLATYLKPVFFVYIRRPATFFFLNHAPKLQVFIFSKYLVD